MTDNHRNPTIMATNKCETYTDNSIVFTIEGNPKALATKSSKKVWLRDPCKDAKRLFRESVRNTVFKGNGESTTGVVFDTSIPLIVDIGFFLQVPQYMFVNNDRHQGRIKPERISSWPTKPDLDNLDKFVLDALQGLIFENDSQVVSQTICKSYDWNPPFSGRNEVHIRPATINLQMSEKRA